jgi:hypothetical protein
MTLEDKFKWCQACRAIRGPGSISQLTFNDKDVFDLGVKFLKWRGYEVTSENPNPGCVNNPYYLRVTNYVINFNKEKEDSLINEFLDNEDKPCTDEMAKLDIRFEDPLSRWENGLKEIV